MMAPRPHRHTVDRGATRSGPRSRRPPAPRRRCSRPRQTRSSAMSRPSDGEARLDASVYPGTNATDVLLLFPRDPHQHRRVGLFESSAGNRTRHRAGRLAAEAAARDPLMRTRCSDRAASSARSTPRSAPRSACPCAGRACRCASRRARSRLERVMLIVGDRDFRRGRARLS